MDLTVPERPLAVISGLGAGLGICLASRFAAAGYDIVGLARSDRVAGRAAAAVGETGGTYRHVICDITDAAQIRAAVGPIAARVQVLIHAAHRLVIAPFCETSVDDFEAVWKAGCFGAMMVSREIVPAMVSRGGGTIVFSGATAGLRGGAKFAAFASAKFALRGLAQALARELSPHGVHVAHVVIDGLIDEPQTSERFGAATAKRLDPMAVADAYLALARQEPSAWSHEIDLRPFSERF